MITSGLGTISAVTVFSDRTAGAGAIPAQAVAAQDTESPSARLARLDMVAKRRGLRVIALCVVILIISIADLELTLRFLTSGGMSEANPLARYIMGFDCQWLLGAWKVMLTSVACGTLLGLRTRLTAELGAWLCAAVMVWLAIRWGSYADYAGLAAEHMLSATHTKPADWVAMTAD